MQVYERGVDNHMDTKKLINRLQQKLNNNNKEEEIEEMLQYFPN